MAKATVKLRGGDELKAKLAELDENAGKAAAAALRTWAGEVRDDARRNVPVDTGYLRSKIAARVEPRYLTAKVGVWDRDAYYSQWVEQGSSRQEPQPFLQPAFRRNRRSFRGHLRTELERRLT